jgi:hypothetical protein
VAASPAAAACAGAAQQRGAAARGAARAWPARVPRRGGGALVHTPTIAMRLLVRTADQLTRHGCAGRRGVAKFLLSAMNMSC